MVDASGVYVGSGVAVGAGDGVRVALGSWVAVGTMVGTGMIVGIVVGETTTTDGVGATDATCWDVGVGVGDGW
ncbi:MAG: hypothetical protein F4X72_08115 [Dehalococcoidia bacterium]|nr:hypothetical protein [Dehalococcoidia bacterium]